MLGRVGAAGAVEVVDDLVVAPAGEVAIEDLRDHRGLLEVGDQPGLVVSGAGSSWVGVRLVLELVAVGGAAAVAVSLPRVLGLAVCVPKSLYSLHDIVTDRL